MGRTACKFTRPSGWGLTPARKIRVPLQGEAAVMSAAVCPYCRAKISEEDVSLACEGCGTPHHADCYTENGGCTIFGCSRAPADEPKMQVSTPELMAVGTQAPAAVVTETRVAAPPP